MNKMGDVPDELEDLIEGKRLIASLATSVDGQPHVAPVWYRYDEGKLQISTSGKKVRNARENPKVAISIEENENGVPEGMVMFEGKAEIIEDEESVKRISKKIYEKYLGEDVEEWGDFFQKQITDPVPGTVIIEIEIESYATQE